MSFSSSLQVLVTAHCGSHLIDLTLQPAFGSDNVLLIGKASALNADPMEPVRDERGRPSPTTPELGGRIGPADLSDRSWNIIDSKAHMVDTLAVLVDPTRELPVGREGLYQLDETVARVKIS